MTGAAKFHHTSVLLEEAVGGLVTDAGGIYVDCTLGGGGHAARIAESLSREGRIIGIDRDGEAIAAAESRLQGAKCRVSIVHDNFKNLAHILRDAGIAQIDGILFDLGVSSHQIDTASRGFSYMQDAPLDMRMDQGGKLSAHEVVNGYPEEELARIFKAYGEERWSRRIARAVAKARLVRPIQTTGELAELIQEAVPRSAQQAAHGHPAKRVFQAIRIEVNDELGILDGVFRQAAHCLKPGGRIAIITFHSLEDRIAKHALRDMARGCLCPPGLPMCVCGHRPEIRILGKPQTASPEETKNNPRAKSAKLRIAEKLSL